MLTDILRLPWAQTRTLLGLCKPHPVCSDSLWHHPAPKGGRSARVQTSRSPTAVFLPEEHPRDCQPAFPPRHIGHAPPGPPAQACDAICSAGTSQGSAATPGTKSSIRTWHQGRSRGSRSCCRCSDTGDSRAQPVQGSLGPVRVTGTDRKPKLLAALWDILGHLAPDLGEIGHQHVRPHKPRARGHPKLTGSVMTHQARMRVLQAALTRASGGQSGSMMSC